MDQAAIDRYICETFPDVETSENFGYKFFFYRDDHRLPFATMADSDNEYDKVSQLDRTGVFRLNFGVSKQTFQSLFGDQELDMDGYDFSALNQIMPHPDYARQYFVCVLNPGDKTLADVRQYLAEAHGIARARYERRSEAN
jgi:hypothetical protein